MFFNLPNLSAQVVATTPDPWDCTMVRPEFETKDVYRRWCIQKTTRHFFYAAYEGANAAARINSSNPPRRIHGLVVDYDSNIEPTEIDASLARNCPEGFAPAWRSRTFSGGARLVWEFEQPVFCYSPAALKDLLGRIRKEFKLDKLLPGLDKSVYLKPDQVYELGTDWKRVSDNRVPIATLRLWIYEAGTKVRWSEQGVDIPLELVAAELERQFPGRWEGEFELNQRGRRFWDPTADDDTAAIVRSAGMQCFTGDKPFVSWHEIFGAAFTRSFQADKVESATNNIYFDNRYYWQQTNGQWNPNTVDRLSLYLRTRAGLSRDAGKKTCSEVDEAIQYIHDHNRVVAAVPFVHHKPGVRMQPDGPYLNTANVTVCAPVEGPVEWGENFPWLDWFFSGLFNSPDQIDHFWAWLRRFYKTAYEQEMKRGHAIFIAGPVGQGKTLLGTKIIGAMMGGATDVTAYMLGETSWNSSHFDRAVWNIDDAEPGKDPRAHAIYSNNIKKHVANDDFGLEKKFTDSARITWTGRTVVTMNDDAASLGMLPEMDISILEKVCFFRAADRPCKFPDDVEKVIRQELPFFCRWVLDWVPPAHTIGDTRFGNVAYHEPSLLAAAKEQGRAHSARELMEIFAQYHFNDKNTETEFEGTSTVIYAMMLLMDPIAPIIRKTHPISLGKDITSLAVREPSHFGKRSLDGRSLYIVRKSLLNPKIS